MSDSTFDLPTVDKSQVPPIDQKRMVAFINHFTISTVKFLNEFMTNVETRFVELESKLRNVESSLLIVEAKLASIPDISGPNETDSSTKTHNIQTHAQAATDENIKSSIETTEQLETSEVVKENPAESENETVPEENKVEDGVRAAEDTRYRKFFKMLQFGVPAPAVKLKMQTEGFDPSILDAPNVILADGISHTPSDEM